MHSGKGNISRIFDVCRAFYRSEKLDRSLMEFFMDYKKTYKDLNVLLPFSQDVKVQQDQREKMAVMGFLAALSFEYDFVRAQILSNSRGVLCYYYRKLGYVIRDFKKLQNKN